MKSLPRSSRLWLCACLGLVVAGGAGCGGSVNETVDVDISNATRDPQPGGDAGAGSGGQDSGGSGSSSGGNSGAGSSSGSGSGSSSGSSSGGGSGSGSSSGAGSGSGSNAYVSYADAVQDGNQPFTGSLGMDFVVAANTSITVTAMGAFDDLANTGSGSITVGIFDTSSQTLVSGTQVTITPATDNTVTLVGGDYFKDLPSAVTLSGGASSATYTVVAVGYGNSYLDGNNGVPGWTLSTDSTGGGKISFTGTSRWAASNGGFIWPSIMDTGPANRYGAGTFLFY
jgi:hypothetical protein